MIFDRLMKVSLTSGLTMSRGNADDNAFPCPSGHGIFPAAGGGIWTRGPFFDADRRFTGMSNEDRPFDADDITDIEELE